MELKEAENMEKIEVARLSDVSGNFGFFSDFWIELHQEKAGGAVNYFVMGIPFRVLHTFDSDWILRVFPCAEDALVFYWNARQLLSSSCWVLDTQNNYILDLEGIRFALTGEVLP